VIGLETIQHVRAPRHAVETAHSFLRRVGRQSMEGFALWVGRLEGDTFVITDAVIPAQKALRLPDGVCVTVGSEELHRLNVWLYQQGLTLLAQLHSHPGAAYHSDTDDTFPIATAVGSLSLVIPDFARSPYALSECAVYRLTRSGGWASLSSDEVSRLITIVE